MIHLNVTEPNTAHWHAWRGTCQQEQTTLNQAMQQWLHKWAMMPQPHDPKCRQQEQPLLINPLEEDPDEHLLLDETGVFSHKTPRGKMCIDLLGLNDRDLPNDRRATYKYTRLLVTALLEEASKDMNSQRTKELLDEVHCIQSGARPFTMAARLAIRQTLGPILPMLQLLLGNE